MDASRPLPAPPSGAATSSAPILPPSQPRLGAPMERRAVEVTLPERARHRRTSSRTYFYLALALGSFSVGAWLALAEYIYG